MVNVKTLKAWLHIFNTFEAKPVFTGSFQCLASGIIKAKNPGGEQQIGGLRRIAN